MVKSITARLSRPALLLIFFALFCCLSGCGGSKDATGTGTTTTDLSSLTLSVPSSITVTPVTVTAILRDTTGALVQGAVVTFVATDTTLAAFTPASATALTDVNGTASITLNAASSSSAGATSITASAPVTSGGSTTTIASAPVGITVYGTPDLSSLALSVPSSITVTPVTVTAILRNASGVLVKGAVVSFAASTSGLVVFDSTTALTDSNGAATVHLSAANNSSVGATYITASAPLTSGGTTTTITSTPVGITVYAATVTLGAITLGAPSISAYGTSSVSVPVYVNNILSTVPISVTFTSNCGSSATITSPVTSNTSKAISTYKDNDCGSGTGITDTITASAAGAPPVSANITILPDIANNIQFISATPSVIGTSTTGATTLSKSSIVIFQVMDSSNSGVGNVIVDFSLTPTSVTNGIQLSATQATSDTKGYVTTAVTAGTVPTPVWVTATIHGSSPAISSESNSLTITTGLPTQNFFSLAVSTHNIEGWAYDGVTSALTVIASDRLGEPVPDGTAVNFITEGAQIKPASCTTTNGTCTVTFISADYKPRGETINYGGTIGTQGAVAALDGSGNPITINGGPNLYVQNGRVTVLAYALGEESFVDSNGNNMWDAGETFYDLGDLFLDSNENGSWDSNTSQPNILEQYISYPLATGTTACGTHIAGGAAVTAYPADYVSAPSKAGTCDGKWGLNYVRRSQVIILSGSHAQISQSTFPTVGSCFGGYTFWLMDENYNPMPAGTTVSINSAETYVNYTYTDTSQTPPQIVSDSASVGVTGTPVLDTTYAGGTPVSLIISGGTGCTAAETAGTLEKYPYGPVAIDVTTPKGNITTIPIDIF